MQNPLWAEELDEALNKYEQEQEREEESGEERFKVKDHKSANWCFRKIKALKEKEKEIEDIAEEEKWKIENWKERETDKIKRSLNFFEGLLFEYFAERREEDPNYKFTSPHGEITTRELQPKWKYLDEEETIEYLKETDRKEFVRIKESLDKREFKKNFEIAGNKVIDKDTGEVIPGIEIEQRDEKVYIKVNED